MTKKIQALLLKPLNDYKHTEQELADELDKNTELVLSLNGIDQCTFKILMNKLAKNTTIKTLNLSHIHNVKSANALIDALSENKTIKDLILTYLDKEKDGKENDVAKNIFSNLNQFTCLQTLNVSSCFLSLDSLKALANSLKTNKTLASLTLLDLKKECVEEFADALESNHSLQSLKLGHFRNIDTIINALYHHSSLTELSFRFDKIGQNGLLALTKLLADEDCCITNLDLYGCNLDTTHMARFTSALSTNTKLQVLNLSLTHISKNEVHMLCCALKSNKHLQQLNLESNQIGDHGREYLQDLQKERPDLVIKYDTKNDEITTENIKNMFAGFLNLSRAATYPEERNRIEHPFDYTP